MLRSLEYLKKAHQYAETGQHAAVVDCLGERPREELEDSPTMSLLFGTAQARLGQHEEGKRWVELALDRSRERADRAIEARALNVRGAIALVAGRIDEAARYFTEALAAAKRDGNHATVGRCSNNLGIIYNLRGEYAHAIGSYTMAMAAFQQAGLDRGVAETRHNLAITYRDQGELERGLEEAAHAVEQASKVGDGSLSAQTVAGRAEIRALAGDSELALKEIERALAEHKELGDAVEEAHDLRIKALALAGRGEVDQAKELLQDTIERGRGLNRPLLIAMASRDLAKLLHEHAEDQAPTAAIAREARVLFSQLGARAEIEKLDAMMTRQS